MYDVTKMSPAEITECSNALGALGAGAGSMEAAANRVVRHLYDNLVDPATSQNPARWFVSTRPIPTLSWTQGCSSSPRASWAENPRPASIA